jgi:hypothetical protein
MLKQLASRESKISASSAKKASLVGAKAVKLSKGLDDCDQISAVQAATRVDRVEVASSAIVA